MNGIVALAKRNILCYLRDRASVLFSMMAVLIVIMLYLLFLRDMLIGSYPDMEGMPHLIDAWVMAGILGIVPVTASAGSLQVMIDDRSGGNIRDFLVTPMTPSAIASGYILSTFAVGMLMSVLATCICLAYLALSGCPLTASGIMATVVLLVPSSLSGSIIVYAMTSFLRSPGAFSGFFTVISVLIGFLTGIYMPMGSMPDAMQAVSGIIPASHMASLFRNTLADGAMDSVFAGAPAETLEGFRQDMGFDISLGGFCFDAGGSILFVLAATAVFFVIAVAALRRR